MAWRIGVDIGGTFTDVALIDDASGAIGVAKVPTTPRDLAEGVLAALRHRHAALWDRARPTSGCCRTRPRSSPTRMLEEKGARAALITTRGFRDVLELRRSARADLYDLFQDAPATLIPRRRRFEITERIGADGAVVTPLAEGEIDGLIADAEGGARGGGRGVAAVQLPQPRRTSSGSARGCGRRCRACRSTCRREVLPEIRSSSAPARRRCAPTSGRSSPRIWSGWKARRAARACRRST